MATEFASRPLRHSQRHLGNLLGTNDTNNEIVTDAIVANADGSLLERLEWLQTVMTPQVITGTTDIDDSVQTESTPYSILTIQPAAGAPLLECSVILDLAKATTGPAAVESSATFTFSVARKVDGTNWRREVIVEAALSGTLAATRAQKISLGMVSVTEAAQIFVTMSADATADMEIPYMVIYRAVSAPTVTPVAAG